MRIHSLTTRFVLTLLLSTVLPFLAFSFFVRAEFGQGTTEFVDERLRLEAAGVVASLSQHLRSVQSECSVLRGLAERALEGVGHPEEFRDEVEFLPTFQDDYHLVVLANAEGRVVAFVENVAAGATTDQRRALRPSDVADQHWFHSLVTADGGVVAGQMWIDRHLSPFMHRDPARESLDPNHYAFGLAFAVYRRDGRVLGAMLALRRWDRVQRMIDRCADELHLRQWPSALVSLSDPSHAVLAHTDRSRYAAGDVSDRLADTAVESGETSSAAFMDGSGEPIRAGVSRMDRSAEPIDWTCVITAKEADLFEQSRRFGDLLLIIALVVGAILVVWSWFASRAILRPVRRLASATERVAAGDFEARVPTQGRDELADLGRAFNDMAGEVSASRDRLAKVERQAAWAEMARQVAHEIKNPLTPMRMSAQLLQRANREKDPRLPELVDRLARTVQEQTDALARIATDFRHFAGQPSQQLEAVSVSTLLGDVQVDFAATIESGYQMSFEDSTDDALVHVDRHEIRRVFLNLVQNAVEAASDDGCVAVSATRASGDRIAFTVADDGPGIDALVRDRLFDPYFTTRSAGTGLGLAICRRIVESHGGTIEVADPGVSDPTSGGSMSRTQFRFFLPSSVRGEQPAAT